MRDRRALSGPRTTQAACPTVRHGIDEFESARKATNDRPHDPPHPRRRRLARVTHHGWRDTRQTPELTDQNGDVLVVAHYVEAVLNRLGYKAQFALNSTDNYFSGDNPNQIGISQWLMDYPTPSSVLEGLRCGANTVGRYCNPTAEKLFSRALDTQHTDPAGAGTVWASLDQTLTNDAAMLNLYTHRSTIVLSDRVGDYMYNPKYGPLFGQMWVDH
jgi:hypothetical protein